MDKYMPEVVEVTLTSLYLHHNLKNKVITGIDILGGRYSRHQLKGLDGFKNNLPLIIDSINSKGKFMWFELYKLNNNGTDYYILNTYGLEGEWGFTKKKHSNVKFEIKDRDKNKTYNLYFTDQRNFGTLEMTPSRDKLVEKIQSLGPDFLKTDFTWKDFEGWVKHYLYQSPKNVKTRGDKPIIKVLMEQKAKTGIGSGLGNYLAVEILYRSGISPYRTVKDLYEDKSALKKLARSIKYVTKLSYLTADVGYFAHLDKKLSKWVNSASTARAEGPASRSSLVGNDLLARDHRSQLVADSKNQTDVTTRREETDDNLFRVNELRNLIKKDKTHPYHYHPGTDIGNDKFKFNVYRQKTDPKGYKVKADKIVTGRTTYWVPELQK